MFCPTNFEETIKKGLNIERALITREALKMSSSKYNPSSSNEKPKVWVKKKMSQMME